MKNIKLIYLFKSIKEKDANTAWHCFRVALLVNKICKILGLSKKEKSKIVKAALIHDIGKINIPNEILLKPSKLTLSEYETIKKHTDCSFLGSSLDPEIIKMIHEHHERYDGKGYPKGLQGQEILKGSRIIAIADSIDAMKSKRVYKESKDKKYIIKELKNNSGTMYDPEIIEKIIVRNP